MTTISIVLACALLGLIGWHRLTRADGDKVSEQATPKTVQQPTDWQRVLNRYPLGTQFDYLGIHMIVVYAFDSTGGEYNWPGELGVQYADKMGIIHNLTFGPNHAKILLDIQPEGGQIGG
jgi:hypothetical protein